MPERDTRIDSTLAVGGFRRHWRMTLLLMAAGAAIFFLASFLITPRYTARVSLLPQSSSSSASLQRRLSALAGLPLESEGSSEALYGQILESNHLLARAASREWRWRGRDEVTLYEIFGVSGEEDESSLLARRDELFRELRKALSFSRDPKNGFMELKVRAPHDAQFAASLANFLVAELESFNLTYRQRKATEQRSFVESREASVKQELSAAEDELTEFVRKNQLYTQSPLLLREFQRRSREVEALSLVWAEARSQLELAKIEEEDTKPSVTVLDHATPPSRKSSPRFLLNAVLGALLGLVLATMRILALSARASSRV